MSAERRAVRSGAALTMLLTAAGLSAALPARQAASPDAGIFVDATASAGIDFTHVSGAFGDKWLPETNGSGAAFFDADGDGWTDLLLVQATTWEGHEEAVPPALRDATMKLYRNAHDGTFTDITVAAGLDVKMYGFGAAPADFDNDGDTDVYVTAYGANRLFRNEGGARFVDVAADVGVDHPGWGTCAAWLDYDRDGDLDLYACNYLRWAPELDFECSLDGETRSYCEPRAFEGEPSVLYRNDGDAGFADVTHDARVWTAGGKSLGVTVADFNGDGWPDLAVANDTEPNFMFENQRDGTFAEVGLVSGMAVDSAGVARAGMGIDAADYRNDGRLTIAIGNFSNEMIGLFEPVAAGVFVDVAPRSQVGRSSLLALTFALFFFDYNLDGRLDLLAINGHVYDNIAAVEPEVGYEQRPLLYRNDGEGSFTEVSLDVGGPAVAGIAGRGAAYADYDRDGDLDVIVTTKEGRAHLWRNMARDAPEPPGVVRLRLTGSSGNRDAIGAEVTVSSGDWRQTQRVRSGSSYLSQSELTLTFGLGDKESVDAIAIRWPNGEQTSLDATNLAGRRQPGAARRRGSRGRGVPAAGWFVVVGRVFGAAAGVGSAVWPEAHNAFSGGSPPAVTSSDATQAAGDATARTEGAVAQIESRAEDEGKKRFYDSVVESDAVKTAPRPTGRRGSSRRGAARSHRPFAGAPPG